MGLKFPFDLSETYYFDLKFKTYTRPSPFTGKINLSDPAIGAAPGSGAIKLPIPGNIVEDQKLNWQQERDALATGAAIDALSGLAGLAGVGLSNPTDKFGDSGAAALLIGAGLAQGVASAAAFAATGQQEDPVSAILQRSGLAMNPVLTQQFKHPEFRQHVFSWTFAPTTEYESQSIQSIIDTIKEQSLPDINAGGAFFSYPSIAMIQIYTGNNGNLYPFQPCVITNVSVNYAPMGVPSFFAKTNAPTMIKLDVSFLEIILNTRSNWKTSTSGFVSGFDFSLGSVGDKLKEAVTKKLKGVL